MYAKITHKISRSAQKDIYTQNKMIDQQHKKNYTHKHIT